MSALLDAEVVAIDEEKRRARWRRNKSAQRDRARPQPRPLNSDFVRRVYAERDRRVELASLGAARWPEATYLFGARLGRAVGLAADVWLAETLHEEVWGRGTASAARICRLLQQMGRTHGYSEGTLRKFIPKARKRIRFLETSGEPWQEGHLYWPPFETW